MWINLLIGLRNLARRRFRTILTALMIASGTGAMVFSVGLAEGTYSKMIDLGTRSFTGHFQIQAPGFKDKPSLFKTVSHDIRSRPGLKGNPKIAGLTARVETAGLISAGDRTLGSLLLGVDPEREGTVTGIPKAISKGLWFSPGESEDLPIIIGKGVAKRLRIDLGAEVSFISQAADGSIAAELFSVIGIIETGTDELDASLALIRIADAQELLLLPGKAHSLVGLARDLDHLEAVRGSVGLPPKAVFLSWAELSPTLERTIEMDRFGLYIFLFIILGVVLLGVTNTMMMAVLERTREFGVMLALGVNPGRLVTILLAEAGWLTGLGVVVGIGLGVFGNYLAAKYGIPMGPDPINYGGVIVDRMIAENTLTGNLIFPLIIFGSGLVAGVLPAFRAAKLSPAEALRAD